MNISDKSNLVKKFLLERLVKRENIKLPKAPKTYTRDDLIKGLKLREKLGWHTIRISDIK